MIIVIILYDNFIYLISTSARFYFLRDSWDCKYFHQLLARRLTWVFNFRFFRKHQWPKNAHPVRLRFKNKVENLPKSVKKPRKSALSSSPWRADNVLIATVVASFALIRTKAIIKCKFETQFFCNSNWNKLASNLQFLTAIFKE